MVPNSNYRAIQPHRRDRGRSTRNNYRHAELAIGVGPFEGPRVPELLVSQFQKIQGVHFYDSAVAIEKGTPFPFKRIIK
jgi:hypothetical protein